MKSDKAAGPSGVVTEMMKAPGLGGAQLLVNLANYMVRNGDMPSDWELSYILNL